MPEAEGHDGNPQPSDFKVHLAVTGAEFEPADSAKPGHRSLQKCESPPTGSQTGDELSGASPAEVNKARDLHDTGTLEPADQRQVGDDEIKGDKIPP